jgi:hypothetical protein
MLPQYKNKKNPTYHKFTVFSIIDDSDTIEPKVVNCNNCGVAHKVIDICKSIINTGREDVKSSRTIDDISLSMPDDVSKVLTSYDCDVATWEHAEFILGYKKWGEFIVLSRESTDEGVEGKILRFESQDRYKIEPFLQRDIIGGL